MTPQLLPNRNRVPERTVPVPMIFIPCKNGISHAKEEFTKISDITKGAEVLANTIYSLVK